MTFWPNGKKGNPKGTSVLIRIPVSKYACLGPTDRLTSSQGQEQLGDGKGMTTPAPHVVETKTGIAGKVRAPGKNELPGGFCSTGED